MKADVYTGFLTDKVKIFSTDKKVKPVSVSGKVLRRAVPVLLASLMSFTGSCSVRGGKALDSEEAAKITAEHPAYLTDEREFLPQSEVLAMMESPSPALFPLSDVNFNHMPENKENFWEIVHNGLQIINTKIANSKRLSSEKKAQYKITALKMLSQISRVKGSKDEVDLRNFNNLKTFLYFEKVIQYKDKYSHVFTKRDGIINEQNAFLGRYYQDQDCLKEKIGKHAGIQKFAKALYACDERFVLHYSDSVQANALSRKIFAEWLEKQDIKDKKMWYYVDCNEYDYCNVLAITRQRGQNFEVVLGVDPKGDLGDGFYSPIGSTLIHELQHVGQTKPSSSEKAEDNHKKDEDVVVRKVYFDDYSKELGPTLYSLAIEDGIYKKIHGFQADDVVDYGNIDLGTHKVSIGKTAVWFGKMMKKYPHLSVDKLIAEPEVFNHLNNLGIGTNVMAMQKVHGGME